LANNYQHSDEVSKMFEFSARVLFLLGWLAIWTTSFTVGQSSDGRKAREMKVASVAGEPVLILRISATGGRGNVSVRNGQGTEVQSLGCSLLRDNAEANPQDLAAVREQFVAQFVVMDVDSDGHPDLVGIREFGAKWARYCVWLYDPAQHIFVKNFLAEQMELLINLTSLGGRLVTSSQMGPTNPWQAVYRIAGARGSRPERQLVPALSCMFETTPGGDKLTALVTTHYDGGQAVVQRQDAGKMSMKEALAKCTPENSIRN
jgi:hypothetical protein